MVGRILVFGDSIGQGYWDVENGGWVQLLFRHFMKSEDREIRDINVINLSVSGHTSRDVRQRLTCEIGILDNGEAMLTILDIGTNDSMLFDDVPAVSEGEFRDNIADIIIRAKERGEVLLLDSIPCVESRTIPVARDHRIVITNDRLQNYNQIKRDEARKAEVRYFSVWDSIVAEQRSRDLLPDGVHPSSEGHRLMFELIEPVVAEMVEGA